MSDFSRQVDAEILRMAQAIFPQPAQSASVQDTACILLGLRLAARGIANLPRSPTTREEILMFANDALAAHVDGYLSMTEGVPDVCLLADEAIERWKG